MSDLSAFRYKARDEAGARHVGSIDAVDREDALRRLRQTGLLPIDATPQATPGVKTTSGKAMGPTQRAECITRLAKLTGSGIPLDAALRIMADGQDGAVSAAADRLRTHMREGGTFMDGLRAQGIDDHATLALVRGAEVSGDLSGALLTAGGLLTQRLTMRRKMLTGLLYPSLLMIVAIIAVGVIMVAIIPQFRPLVADRMDVIPPLGRMIFAVSSIITSLWKVFLVALALGAAAALWLKRQGKIGPLLAQAGSRLPLVRDVVALGQVTITLHILGALLARDVVLSQALRVVTGGLPAGRVRDGLEQARTRVEGGESLSTSLKPVPGLARSAIEMVRIGEEAGDLPGMIARAADEMRENADRALERFLALFQPALIVGVGLIVGVSLYALFSAITAVNSIAF